LEEKSDFPWEVKGKQEKMARNRCFHRELRKIQGGRSRIIPGKSLGQILLFYKRDRIIWRITIFCQSKKYLDSKNKSLIDCFDFSPVLPA
jgi:hypothetical protein